MTVYCEKVWSGFFWKTTISLNAVPQWLIFKFPIKFNFFTINEAFAKKASIGTLSQKRGRPNPNFLIQNMRNLRSKKVKMINSEKKNKFYHNPPYSLSKCCIKSITFNPGSIFLFMTLISPLDSIWRKVTGEIILSVSGEISLRNGTNPTFLHLEIHTTTSQTIYIFINLHIFHWIRDMWGWGGIQRSIQSENFERLRLLWVSQWR